MTAISGEVLIEVADWDDPDGVALRAAQRVEIDGMYGADTEPGNKPTAADVTVFLVARSAAGEPLGCGALRHLEGPVAEIKRMFVPVAHRGRGLSRLLLSRLEDEALSRGWSVLRLETGPLQTEALGLYTSAGYDPIPLFGPYVGAEQSLCFERRLTAPAGSDSRNPALFIIDAVDSSLRLARTWLAWDGRPRLDETGERIYTPHKAIRRIADHLIDHLAEVEAILAGHPTEPDGWHGSLATFDSDWARFTETDLAEANQRLRRLATTIWLRYAAAGPDEWDRPRGDAWTLRQIAEHLSSAWYAE